MATVDGTSPTPPPRHNSTGESKTNFEWDRWLSIGCQAGPSTPQQSAEYSGLAPFHVHRLSELSIVRQKGKSKIM
eukprot:scaffold51146_cov71-Cyclotella_meneghiniana.AAC.4